MLDANVLIAAAFGRSSGAIAEVQRAAALATTDQVLEEARRRIELGAGRPDLLPILGALAEAVAVVPVASLEPLLEASRTALRDAVPSRNGSVRDAHVLALAWAIDGDVWTMDRDFAGTGVATWSTSNLMRAIAEAAST